MSKIAGATQCIALLAILAFLAWLHPLAANASPAATPMPMPMPSSSTAQSELERDRALALIPDSGLATPATGTEWSIVNHRGAGFFVFMWGFTALIAGLQYPRKTWFRFVPPMMLFGLAEFLILRNDPKAWPSGPISFWVSFQDPSATQHRIFVLLVIAIGVVATTLVNEARSKTLSVVVSGESSS
jgi:hypothetical protein